MVQRSMIVAAPARPTYPEAVERRAELRGDGSRRRAPPLLDGQHPLVIGGADAAAGLLDQVLVGRDAGAVRAALLGLDRIRAQPDRILAAVAAPVLLLILILLRPVRGPGGRVGVRRV